MNIRKIFIAAITICMILTVFVFVSCDKEEPMRAPEPSDTEAQTKDSEDESSSDAPDIPAPPVKKSNYIVSVEDFDGESVSGITVEIYNGTDVVCSGETDSNGKFAAELESSQSYTAKISEATGYLFDEKQVAFDKNGRVSFTVTKAVEYTISVKDALDEAAIANVKIELYTRRGNLAATGITDSDGIARIWAEELYYSVLLKDVPEGYENKDKYILDTGTYGLSVMLFNPNALVADGRDKDHPLVIYHGNKFNVGAEARLYCSAPETSGCILKIENAHALKVEYNGVEYTAQDGTITVRFESRADDDKNTRDVPNAFVITNMSDSEYTGRVSMLSPDDREGTEKNPFILDIGVKTQTPEFIIGTSQTEPGISRYCYRMYASQDGFYWIDTFDASIVLYINGSIVTNDKYEYVSYSFVRADDVIDVHVESMEWLSSDAVSFTANLDGNITEIPDRFTCEHVYDSGCDAVCNKCGNIRLPIHTETIIPAVEPTCTQSGLTEGTKCEICGATVKEQKEVPALGHTERKTEGFAPTCTQSGLTDGAVCTVCEQTVLEQKVIPATGHREEIVEGYKPTCTENGLTDGVICYVCGQVLVKQTPVLASGHREQLIKGTPPTCTEAGISDGKICSVCNITLEEQKSLEATGHTWSSVYKYDDNYHWQVCEAECGETTERGAHEFAQSGSCICGFGCSHDEVEWSIEKEASCSEEGREIAVCKICGAIAYSRTTEKLAHTPGAAATCTAAQTCTVCSSVIVPAKGHIAGAAATCTTAQMCTVCDAELIAALGHTPGAEATCTEAQICSVCGFVMQKAKGHVPNMNEATCAAAKACVVCKKVLEDKKAHTPGAAATCTEPQRCTVCGFIIAKASGHAPGAAATCTTDQICTSCGEVLKKAAHTPGQRPTCYSPQRCTVCNDILAPMLEHKAGGEATCTDGQSCIYCGTQLSEPLGHKYNANGICTVCGEKVPSYVYKITVRNASDSAIMSGIKVNFYDPITNKLIASLKTDADGYVEYVSSTLKNATVIAEELPDGYSAESFFLGKDSYFGFEYTMNLVNQYEFIYDGRDENHPLNVGMGDGSITVAANSTIYCMYTRVAGVTMKINNADGIKVIYNGAEYTAVNGTVTVKFDIKTDSSGNVLPEYETSRFTIINTTEESITLKPII